MRYPTAFIGIFVVLVLETDGERERRHLNTTVRIGFVVLVCDKMFGCFCRWRLLCACIVST